MRVILVAVVLLVVGSAWGNPCTVTGTVTGAAAVQQPVLSIGIAGTYDVDANWTIQATGDPNVSCATPSLAYQLNLSPTYVHDGGGYSPGGDGTPGSGSSMLEADYAGNLTVWGAFACGCGFLGGDTIYIPSASVLVPPVIELAPQVIPAVNDFNQPVSNWDGLSTDLPVGDTFQIETEVSAVLCPGDTLTFTWTGAGINQTETVPATTECVQDSYGPTMTFTPTSPGPITFAAQLDGVSSNTVTFTAAVGGGTTGGSGSTGSSGSGTSGSTGHSTTGSTPKIGCSGSGNDLSFLGLAGLLAALATRRRQPGV